MNSENSSNERGYRFRIVVNTEMTLHHVGIVVKDLASYGGNYAQILGLVADSPVYHDPIQQVNVQFWRDGQHGTLLELIEPASPESPVWRSSQKGGGLDHLCYETSGIEKQIEEAVKKGGMVARPLNPAVAFGGRRIVFIYFLELGLIEFVETVSPAP